MVLKYTNAQHTSLEFNGCHFSIDSPDNWDSIGDGPTREMVRAYLNDGGIVVPYSRDVSELIQLNVMAIQNELDRKAQEKGYDNIISACSYASGENLFQAEGLAFLKWRSDVWAKAYETLHLVQSGTIPLPTPEEAVAAMPALVLPT